MWGLVQLTCVLFGGFVLASDALQTYGFPWAYRVCSSASLLCGHSEIAALVFGSCVILYCVLASRSA